MNDSWRARMDELIAWCDEAQPGQVRKGELTAAQRKAVLEAIQKIDERLTRIEEQERQERLARAAAGDGHRPGALKGILQ